MLKKHNNNQGFALLFVFFFVILVAGIVVAFLELTSQSTSDFSTNQTEEQAFYAAEAAQARAVQYLQNDWSGIWNTILPVSGDLITWYNPQYNTFVFGPITEALYTKNSINYDFIVDIWNLAYRGNPAPFGVTTATVSSTQAANAAERAINGQVGNGQFWRSAPPWSAQSIRINFPAGSNYTIGICRFRSLQGGGNQVPMNYSWTITPAAGLPTVINVNGNAAAEKYDFFTPVANVVSVQLDITAITGGASVRIDEIEIPWIRIRSCCRNKSRFGSSYSGRYIRNCVLTNSRTVPVTITKITPSALSGTNITSIWDEISYNSYRTTSTF
ncbi:MAG: hypothetical protein PHH44_04140 [bacterium]|jgi:uncharacterized protein (UPF0333 family)|nr:hypothetical protein [bacterium]